ncbi:MAG: universal stress protein [Lysobacterales bacterium]|jgi:nucleotide-binding universal stress UspA family protein
MTSILVATDLTPRSDRAVRRAARMARDCDASLTVLYVIDDILPAAICDQLESHATKELGELVGDEVNRLGVPAETRIEFGKPDRVILETAHSAAMDLIVFGTHREGPESLRGTTIERVLRTGSVPCLMAVRRGDRKYRRAIVGIDFSVHSRRAVEFALKFLPDAQLTFTHAFHIPYRGLIYAGRKLSKSDEEHFKAEVDAEYQRFLADLDLPASRIERMTEEGSARAVLRRCIEDCDADLVVLGTHGRSGISKAMLGSVAEDFLGNPPCDVAVVKAW